MSHEEYAPPPQPDELIWAAVDFDGTVCYSTWRVDNPTAPPGEPIWENIRKLNQLIDAGYKIVIHTSRAWADYVVIEHWFNHYGIHFDKIICGKLLAKVYVDDRAVNAFDEWLSREDQIDAWHNSDGDGPLHGYLNMSWEEYKAGVLANWEPKCVCEEES